MRNELNRLVAQQGWSDAAVLDLALRFIEDLGRGPHFVGFAEMIAREENGWSDVYDR